ncbi:hypothetical protein MW887_002223 [Aspergillus wentii]|nr:hypothetical protein MW887_002223 [Aspergillus wentii]
MRLKVLYTFDNESKTNCLARWPHLLEIQTAALDEKTQVGVIELKTCIQAIVSASVNPISLLSPELVAQLGQDYTVYAYDYSEYETPLVGQGMLSWVLASSSPTPNAPAHQSKTMVTGRVCKNVLGLFSKGAQETLEVKLRLVPVPTVMQSEYLESMQKYRELSNYIPHEFDAQSWTNFLRQNPGLMANTTTQQVDRTTSPMDHAGIERFHRLLSEGSTPRELPSIANDPFRSASPSQSILAPSRVSTPGGQRPSYQQQQQQDSQQSQHQNRPTNDAIRPTSSASMCDSDFANHPSFGTRRGSMQSGYGSGDDSADPQPRKRAKLYRTEMPGKSDFNIERQPSSLRVAASTAASVRIHRPTPVNPAIAAAQSSNEEPVRPPTPIGQLNDFPRRTRPPPSLLRESSTQSNAYTSPYPMSDDIPLGDLHSHSPEASRYQGIFEPSFSMPSSPPVLDCAFPNRSSPVLPPISTDPDSGFMSGGIDEIMEDDIGTPLGNSSRSVANGAKREKRMARSEVQPSSPAVVENQGENFLVSDGMGEQPAKEAAPTLPRAPASAAGSRPSSRASVRQAPKALAPAPISQSELEQLIHAIPASDPVMPSQGSQHPHSWNGPMSDFGSVATPPPQVIDDGKNRSGAGAKRLKQVQARLDKCIRDGQVPPFCVNCGSIETPTWRRAWTKELAGTEQDANELMKDPTMLFWRALERDDAEKVTKFKLHKKSLVDADKDFVQILLCNPCGLWLHKFKTMRPENKWNKSANNSKKRPPRNRKSGPLSNNGASTRSRSKAESTKPAGSSPAGTDASSPPTEDGNTPRAENENDNENEDDVQEPPSKRRRATSAEPRKSSDTTESRWHEQDASEALERAIQSSPARNMDNRNAPAVEQTPTSKPVRRVLFPNTHNEGALKPLGDSVMNSPRRSPRVHRESDKQSQDKENQGAATHDDLDGLFESPNLDFDLPTSPTPRRRIPRPNVLGERRLSLPNSPSAARKENVSDLTPTKLTAQKLQRIQGGAGSASRQNKTPKQSRSQVPDLPELSDDVFGPNAFESMNGMVVDIFEEDSVSAANTDSFFPFDSSKSNNNWPDWVPSDYVSPVGSDEDQVNGEHDIPDDIINAILSGPDIQKENLHNFDPFSFDSSFLGSDALGADLMALGVKAKSSDGSANKEQPHAASENDS